MGDSKVGNDLRQAVVCIIGFDINDGKIKRLIQDNNNQNIIFTNNPKELWNFHRYSPGLVGGHCIPVDPYYMVCKAKELDYHPQVILAGRAINDYMSKHIAEMVVRILNEAGKATKGFCLSR